MLTDRNITYEQCMDGDVRLRDGTNHLEGRLEICMNNAWGTVCEDEFTSAEARIVCSQLGFNEGKGFIPAEVDSDQPLYRCIGGAA